MNLKAKDYVFIVIVAIGTILFMYQKFSGKLPGPENSMRKAMVTVGEAEITAALPGTDAERYKGLGDRESITDGQGMLFIMGGPGKHRFVMRGMLFDLDFVFINEDTVVDIARSVSKNYKGEIVGMVEYNYVLEVNADWTKRNDIKIGDKVVIEEL